MTEEAFVICPQHEIFYMESMLFIAESALRSVKSANDALQKMDNNSEVPEQNKTLNHLQGVVVQGAALSRYFWPSNKNKRGEALRIAFKVDESSALQSRALRNAIEHFDERLDDYLAGGIVGHIIPHYIGPFSEPGDVPCHLFRAYYTDRGIFEVLGKRFEINPIVAEIARIHKLLAKACDSDGRLPK